MNKKEELTPTELSAERDHISYQELLDRESNPVPASLREDTQTFLGSDNLPFERYLSREFHEREVDKMWNRTWQMACRESQLSAAGDYFVYDIARYSILITRTEAGEIKAYYNSCLHRGRMLKRGCGNAVELRCPYHSFAWGLDGQFKGMPCGWDFEHVDKENFSLPEAKVDTWGGWVMINMDPEAAPLAEYLGVLPEHFKRWQMDRRYVALHVEKVIRCNWKSALEAFIESYHAVQTHPQILSYSGIDNSQYDIWGDNISRTITTMGTVNPSHEQMYTEQDCIEAILGTSSLIGEGEEDESVGSDKRARDRIAEINYETFSEQSGLDLKSFATKSEVMDSILYLVFPNFAPWAGFHPAITYRHRPNGDDHESCIMDIFILNRYPEGEERPQDVQPTRLGPDDPFSSAPELDNGLGRVFDQDGSNLPFVHNGMKTSGSGAAVLANYQEVRIRHFHQTLDTYLNEN